MDPVLMGIIITGALGVASSAGIWGFFSSRQDRPLKAREVENATLTTMQASYSGLLKDLREDLDRVGAEVDSQGNEIRELRAEIRAHATTIQRLRLIIHSATSWIDDIHNRWGWHRLQEEPPPRPNLEEGDI